MYRWRRKILFALIVYFAGFATAIYTLAPVADADAKPDLRASQAKYHNAGDSGPKSERFALAFSSHMHKCISVAEEQAEKIGEFINAKLAERRTKGER